MLAHGFVINKDNFDEKEKTRSSNKIKGITFWALLIKNRFVTPSVVLKKSINDYQGAFTDIRCQHCGSSYRFFKSTNKMANGCSKCGEYLPMSDIWKALNK